MSFGVLCVDTAHTSKSRPAITRPLGQPLSSKLHCGVMSGTTPRHYIDFCMIAQPRVTGCSHGWWAVFPVSPSSLQGRRDGRKQVRCARMRVVAGKASPRHVYIMQESLQAVTFCDVHVFRTYVDIRFQGPGVTNTRYSRQDVI